MIEMHDLMQEMGWHIVNEESPKEPGRRSRLWNDKDIYHALINKTGTETVEAIFLDSFESKMISLSPDTFSRMSKLRLLKLRDVQLPDGLDYLSSELRLLDWNEYPSKCLPSNFQPTDLVRLNMCGSGLQQPWKGIMCLEKLKYINLSHSLHITKTPDFTQAENLEVLVLEGCWNLIEVDPSIGWLKKLVCLNLIDCRYLKVLPTGSWLKSLEKLSLSRCSKLENISEVIAFTECLSKLDVDGTCIKELPAVHLSNLTDLFLYNCKELTSLPDSICRLKLLRYLMISDCPKFNKLPESLGELESLENLRVERLGELTSLPNSICGLKLLDTLVLSDCSKLKELPENLGELKSLKYLFVESLGDFTNIPNSICGLKLLCTLVLSGCSKLNELPENLGELDSLMVLHVLCLGELTSLPNSICGLKLLHTLVLVGCPKLTKLPDNLGELESLQELYVGSIAMKEVPSSILLLKNLCWLSFTGCKGGVMSTLECQEPTGLVLPPLSGLCSLKTLDLSECNISEGILRIGPGSLSSLQHLCLRGNNFISLPAGISGISTLVGLQLDDCKKLKVLSDLPPNIGYIDASGCTSLERLPNLSIGYDNLCTVVLSNCHTVAKNQPNLPFELFRSLLEGPASSVKKGVSLYGSIPGNEFPKWLKHQNNEGPYVGIQLLPNWYLKLEGFVVSAVYSAKAPIDSQFHVVFCGLSHDVLVYARTVFLSIRNCIYQSDHLFLRYMPLSACFPDDEISSMVNRLKAWTDLIVYIISDSTEAVKCAAHMVYDDEQHKERKSIRQRETANKLMRDKDNVFVFPSINFLPHPKKEDDAMTKKAFAMFTVSRLRESHRRAFAIMKEQEMPQPY